MTPDEIERMYALCRQIIVEKDKATFMELVKQLNELLEDKNKRLGPRSDKRPNES
jgi:hypothetical protein